MKREIRKTAAVVLAVIMVLLLVSSCGKNGHEPKDSLTPQETYVEATVSEPQASELDQWIQEVLGDDVQWNGDYASLTEVQKLAIAAMLKSKGYTVKVTDDGIVYYEYVPTADEEEIAQVVSQVLPEKQWDGKYSSLSDSEKKAVQKALEERGYDVDVGEQSFEFKSPAARKLEQTTRAEYNQLPDKEMLSVLLDRILGAEGFKTWDGSFLSMTDAQRSQMLNELNDYGYDLAINEKGEMYIVHLPEYKLTYDTAYSAVPSGGTTAPTTTIPVTEKKNEAHENVTGTSAKKVLEANELERVAVQTYGGSGSDRIFYLAPTSDGGAVAILRSTSKNGDLAGADDSWQQDCSVVMKLDADLQIEWKDMMGAANMFGLTLKQIAQLNDGSYVAVGYRNASNNVKSSCLIVRYDRTGKRIGTTELKGSQQNELNCVAAAPDGGFVVGGQTESGDGDFAGLTADCHQAFLMKFSAAGEREWIRAYAGGGLATHFDAVAVTESGAIYAACQATASITKTLYMDMAQMAGFGGSDTIVFKFNAQGELIKYRPVAGSGADRINCLTLCSDGGVLVGGSTAANEHPDSVFVGQKNRGKQDAFLVRLDAYLDVEWVKTYGGSEDDEITAVVQTKDGFVAVGTSSSGNGDFTFLGAGDEDAFVLTISRNGTETQKYALNGSNADRALAVCVTDGEVYVAGAAKSTDGSFAGKSPSGGNMFIAYAAKFRQK